METDGRVYGPIAPKVIVPIPEPDIENVGADRDPPTAGMELSSSADRENWKYQEQNETGREVALPPGHMDTRSRQNRAAAHRTG